MKAKIKKKYRNIVQLANGVRVCFETIFLCLTILETCPQTQFPI